MTATAITTTLQLNMKNTERATVMPLWFMVFGGTVPIGNLIFGVVIEWIGVRAVLGFGAVFAALPRVVARPASPPAVGVPRRSRRRRTVHPMDAEPRV